MNPMYIVMAIVVLAWLSLALTLISLVPRGQYITDLYRRRKDPPYPLTAEEIWHEAALNHNNPLKTIPMIVKTVIRQQKILWGRHSDDQELAEATTETRSIFLKGLGAFFLIVCLLIAFFIWAGMTGRITNA